MGYPAAGLCPASSSRLWVTDAGTTRTTSAAWPAKPSRCAQSASAAGETRSALGVGAGDRLWLSGSTGNCRFLNGSLSEEVSAGRLRDAPLAAPGDEPPFVSKPSAPVRTLAAGAPPVGRASLTRSLQSGVPRSRWVVRRSSGAAATEWWSPFMVMILGINRDWEAAGRPSEELSGECAHTASRRAVSVWWDLPEWPPVRNPHPCEIKWAAIKSSAGFLLCHWFFFF